MTRLPESHWLRAARLAVLTLVALAIPRASHAQGLGSLGDTSCGQLGQPACLLGTSEWVETGTTTGCDRGLSAEWWGPDARFHCVNGSRQSAPVNDWTSRALRLQRELQADSPLIELAVLSGHNAFNNFNDGYTGYPNQQYSITDLLRMGVRRLALDVHWVNNALRLCHGKEQPLGEGLPTVPHAGCSPWDRPFFQAIEELDQWMRRPENSQEVVFLDLETYVDGRYAELVAPIQTYLSSLVARRAELNSGTVSINQLRALGRRLVIVGPAEAGTELFIQDQGEGCVLCREDHPVKDFAAASCGYYAAGTLTELYPSHYPSYPAPKRHDFGEDSVVYPFDSYNGPEAVGVITPEVLRQLTACHVPIISLDQVTPDKIQHAVWSWDVNKPNPWNNDTDCASMPASGRWSDARCGELRRFACIHPSNKADWKVTAATGPWQQGASQCLSEFGSGFEFAVPRTGYENRKLAAAAGGQDVWLNISDSAGEGIWSSGAAQASTVQLRALGKCMDDSSGQASTGANVILRSCNGGSHQKWILPGDGTIRSAINSNKCLDMVGSSNGANILVWDCHGASNQRWYVSGSFLRSAVNWNRVLDVYGGNTADGTRIQAWDYHGGANQQWTQVPQ